MVGIDIGKNSFHVVGLDRRGAIVLRQRWSRGQVEARFANLTHRAEDAIRSGPLRVLVMGRRAVIIRSKTRRTP